MPNFAALLWIGLVGVALAAWSPAPAAGQQTLDAMDSADRWEAVASDGVVLAIKVEADGGASGGRAIRLDFDFRSGAGFAGIRRKLDLPLAENYELNLRLRGDLPENNLEVKLVDPSGENVWWVNRRSYDFPTAWTTLVHKRRHLQFAWGPAGPGTPLATAGAIEIVVASVAGGRGTVWLDELTYRELPPQRAYAGVPRLAATSGDPSGLMAAEGGDWSPAPGASGAGGAAGAALTLDFGESHEFGGLKVESQAGAGGEAAGFEVQFSDDGATWRTVRTVAAGRGAPGGRVVQRIALPESQSRQARLVFAPGAGARVRRLAVEPVEFAADANSVLLATARGAAPGLYPRYTTGRQSFWTVVGASEDEREALINEEGMIEVDRKAFSIDPFVHLEDAAGGRLLTWNGAELDATLLERYLPIPSVVRRTGDVELRVTAFVDGEAGASTLYAMYQVSLRPGAAAARGRLLLALRPLQVNPPWQFLNTVGGVAPVRTIEHSGAGTVLVDPARGLQPLHLLTPLPPEGGFGASTADEGDATSYLARGELPPHQRVDDPERGASAAAGYPFALGGGDSMTVVVAYPLHAGSPKPPAGLDAAGAARHASERMEGVAAAWRGRLDRVRFTVPPEGGRVVDTLKANLAYILINRDGAGFQPGSRSYERSWIRDGSMTSAALLEMGLFDEVKRFVAWYAPFQFPSGKVPCVVDRRGPDPVPEHDSHGQLVFAIANHHRYTKDAAFLESMFPHVERAVGYIESLRAQRMTGEFTDAAATRQEPGKPPVPATAFFGLVPESISHEGYSNKPMHSYWDDFFVLRGLKDAVYAAKVLGRTEQAARWATLEADFRRDLLRSIAAAMKAHGIDYIPGCVELGDFDATSTTIALIPGGEMNRLPREALERTFERWWGHFERRRDDPAAGGPDYTPYELRILGSLTLLGRKDRAYEALRWFMEDQLPAGWLHWGEIVHRDRRAGKWIGDMPHTWVGSDGISAIRAMFAYEEESDESLVLLAGIPDDWFAAPGGVGVSGMRSPHGTIHVAAEMKGDALAVQVGAGLTPPPGGVIVRGAARPIVSATVNGAPATVVGSGSTQGVRVDRVPAQVMIQHGR